jgi:uncharacterized protein
MGRVVADINAFISSIFDGNQKEIITLCVSRDIIDEYVEVLKRLGLKKEKELQELLKIFAEGHNIIVFAASTPSLLIVEQDPKDNMFIECAVALECSCIISGDKHLKSIDNYMGIEILGPKEFLERFHNSSIL